MSIVTGLLVFGCRSWGENHKCYNCRPGQPSNVGRFTCATAHFHTNFQAPTAPRLRVLARLKLNQVEPSGATSRLVLKKEE
jgi:hypothetical protein